MISSTNSHKQQSNEGQLSELWVLALFKKLQAIYLSKWTASLEGIEDTAVNEWSRVLSGLTGEQIKNGLDSLSDEWPPSAIGFRASCEGKAVNGFGLDYTPEYHREVNRVRPENRLSSTERDKHRKEISKAGMAGLKSALRG